METFSLRWQIVFTVLLFVMLLLLVPNAGLEGDVQSWTRWATYIFEHGLGSAYLIPDNMYNPLYHYILWLYGKLAGSVYQIELHRHWLKAFTLVFDFAGAFWAASLVSGRERRFLLALLLLLNLGYLYNTLIWVQVDAIYTFFAFGAVVLALQQRAVWSMLLFVLSLATKVQAVIFLPPLLLLWVPLWKQRPLGLAQGIGGAALLLLLILAPFIWQPWHSGVPTILRISFISVDACPFLSVNAYNFWHLAAKDVWSNDSLLFAGLKYRTWGVLLFCGASGLALLPVLAATLARLRSSASAALASPAAEVPLVLLGVGMIPLLFAFFNTQMHERYWHASVLFMAAYGFVRRDYWVYVLVSVAYFLNLEGVMHYLELQDYYFFLFNTRFIASLFAIAIGIGLFKLYRLTPWRDYWQRIRWGETPPLA